MDFSTIVMWVGFALASYSVVGNDVIQTLGTFLTSNEKKIHWSKFLIFTGGIMFLVLLYGYASPTMDIAYGRLDKFVFPEQYAWYYALPPLVLMFITRLGIPVSTTFMILTLFSLSNIPADIGSLLSSLIDIDSTLGKMTKKSLIGYAAALTFASIFYVSFSKFTEKRFIENPIKEKEYNYWLIAQWFSTAFLWSQWLTQDLANIYAYLNGGRDLNVFEFILSLVIIIGLLGYILASKGGKVQNVVREKTNTDDIRSATFVDLFYGLFLLFFKFDYFGIWGGKLPMSTTWIFLGLLAGREIGIRFIINKGFDKSLFKLIMKDFGKVTLGLVVSVALVVIIKLIGG